MMARQHAAIHAISHQNGHTTLNLGELPMKRLTKFLSPVAAHVDPPLSRSKFLVMTPMSKKGTCFKPRSNPLISSIKSRWKKQWQYFSLDQNFWL